MAALKFFQRSQNLSEAEGCDIERTVEIADSYVLAAVASDRELTDSVTGLGLYTTVQQPTKTTLIG